MVFSSSLGWDDSPIILTTPTPKAKIAMPVTAASASALVRLDWLARAVSLDSVASPFSSLLLLSVPPMWIWLLIL
ncbi:hypothetical protein EUGRSUZ_H03401 [Eucalyptus grandis]|uniref:Uncharacterized protein n=2 Tax=Eucalyptus grandis TaxID=71139 RepID=A0A059B433_EUCGR|nr:hypothetical protein EUGRSUZ_H03401 [Eucalyptus grandis]